MQGRRAGNVQVPFLCPLITQPWFVSFCARVVVARSIRTIMVRMHNIQH